MTIAECLQARFPEGHYDALFTPAGGYLTYTKSKWNIAHGFSSKNKDFIYSELSGQICREGMAGVINPEGLTHRINEFFFKADFLTAPVSGDVIRFNSHQKGFEFLSNFYPTLIVDSQGQVYGSAEEYYHIQVVKKISPEEEHFPEKGSSALRWKKWGEGIQKKALEQNPHMMDSLLKLKRLGMEMVTRRKYEQNPYLKDLLCSTSPYPIQELSSTDAFFGANEQGEGQNILGQILMKQRELFSSKI